MRKECIRLNLGCGDNKIKGYINIDGEKRCRPDVVLDIKYESLPYKKESVSEVLLFHCIEHIEKKFHRKILLEVGRVLKTDAIFYISYPNFWECAQRWHDNTGGNKTFWEATIYGRQLYRGDYHVCIIDTNELTSILYECGFKDVISYPEPDQIFNTVTVALKDAKGPIPSYETVIVRDMQSMVVKE